MSSARKTGTALAITLVMAACRTEVLRESAPVEGASSQALSANELYGTSLPAKTLALTFDDGPGASTAAMSTYLAAQGIHATFFFVGAAIAPTSLPNPNGTTPIANPSALLAKVVADGHLVANHTTTHRDLAGVVYWTGASKVVQEVAETDVDITPYVASSHFLFRAPYGYYDQNVYSALHPSAMNKYVGPIRWDIGGSSTNYPAQAADWACWQNALSSGGGNTFGASTHECGDSYLEEITNVGRGIVLMHDSSSSANGSTLAMVQYIVPILKSRGYAFARADAVPEIAALLGEPSCDPSCASCTSQGTCASCSAGAYLSGGACRTCSTCNDGAYLVSACTTSADTVCGACDPTCATCSGAGATRCTSCVGDAWLSGGRCRACVTCAAGSYESQACNASSDAQCTACGAGTFAPGAGALACTMCEPGTFAGASGATACTTCAPGTFAPAAGATACSACDAGEFSSQPGATACSSCEAGTFAPAGSMSCAPCPGGTSSGDGAAACQACSAGSYAASGAPSCTACEPGTFAPTPGVASCTSCGSCDDGDECSADTCDAIAGCTHAPIVGCVHALPDAGTPDSGTTDGGRPGSGKDAATTPLPAEAGNDAPPGTEQSSDPTEPGQPGGDSDKSGCTMTRSGASTSGGALGFAAIAALVTLLRARRRRLAHAGDRVGSLAEE